MLFLGMAADRVHGHLRLRDGLHHPVREGLRPTPMAVTPDQIHAATGRRRPRAGGLPQFDLAQWPGQIVWMLIIFAVMLFLFARVFVPRVGGTIAAREDQIAGDIGDARRLKDEADAQADGRGGRNRPGPRPGAEAGARRQGHAPRPRPRPARSRGRGQARRAPGQGRGADPRRARPGHEPCARRSRSTRPPPSSRS